MVLLIEILMALAAVAFIAYPLVRPPQAVDELIELSQDTEELYRRKESAYSALKELEFDYKTGKLSEQDYHDLDAKYRAEAVQILEAIAAEESDGGKEGGRRRGRRSSRSAATLSADADAATAADTDVDVAAEEASLAIDELLRPDEDVVQEPVVAVLAGLDDEPSDISREDVAVAATAARRRRGGAKTADVSLECISCSYVNPAGARFCGSCGEALLSPDEVLASGTNGKGGKSKGAPASACEECGSPLKPGSRFCGRCGAEVQAS